MASHSPIQIKIPRPLTEQEKKNIYLTLAARLILWTGYWRLNETTSGYYKIGFSDALRILYKGVTGQDGNPARDIQGTTQNEVSQTIAILWIYKQRNILDHYQSSKCAGHYPADYSLECGVFFGQVSEFLSRLSRADQLVIQAKTIRCSNEKPSNSFCKLLKP